MNIDSPRNSNNFNQCTVTSKFFSGTPGMDDSLSEFQEKKKAKIGPNTSETPSVSKNKSRKGLKRIRGQKDIRTALKSKKSELISYANDFEKICKKSGIDVDPEQLQLAIAISKSLQQTVSKSEDDLQSSGSLSAQERTRKIRTTLQEYGFKVPKIKITSTRNKKFRLKKSYKLLLLTTAEKEQIISDRYSQVLFQNLDNSRITAAAANQANISKVRLYNIATNIAYEYLKSNNLFYLDDLIEKSPSTVGCLLRDWSEIPGRPVSPNCDPSDINFTDIECSQDELDSILSGSLKCAQDMVRNKHKLFVEENSKSQHMNILNDINEDIDIVTNMVVNSVESNELTNLTACNELKQKQSKESDTEFIDLEVIKTLTVAPMVRNRSPDIFDDEVSYLMNNSTGDTDIISQEVTIKSITKDNNDFMDLTECVNIQSQRNLKLENTVTTDKPISQSSQGTNTTKRKSNDFMEITECVAGISQPTIMNVEDHIDLTQNRTRYNKAAIPKTMNVEENIDLTQNSDQDNDEEEIVKEINESTQSKNVEPMDLTQSSDSGDSLPFVQISGTSKSVDTVTINDASDNDKPLEDTLILSYNAFGENNDSKLLIAKENEPEINNSPHTKSRKPKVKIFDALLTKDCITSTKLNANNEPISSIAIDSDDEIEKLEHSLSKRKDLQANVDSIKQSISKEIHDIHRKSKPESCVEEFMHICSDEKQEYRENVASPETTVSKSIEDDIKGSENINSKSKSFFKEFVHNHLDDGNTENVISLDDTINDVSKVTENNNFNLTQTSELTEEVFDIDNDKGIRICYNTSNLGKKDDISIDYDEIFDNVVQSCTSHSRNCNFSKVYNDTEDKSDTVSGTLKSKSNIDLRSSSQDSDVFEISDKELDYSLSKSKQETEHKNFDLGGISIMDNISMARSSKSSNFEYCKFVDDSTNDSFLPMVELKSSKCKPVKNTNECKLPTALPNIETSTPLIKRTNEDKLTPINSEYIIKTDQVTPMSDYASMATPERNKELDKYGLKPFKRKRAIQLLTHLYNQTHPVIASCSNEDLPSPSKKLKTDTNKQLCTSPKKTKAKKTLEKNVKSPIRSTEVEDLYEVTNEVPEVKNIECGEDDWVFQKREKAKLHSCQVPLHIAFHNYVSARRRLREAVLRYEPVNIDVIHKGLVASGHRYDPKDLLKFMDKKCITVKTVDSGSKNNKKRC